MNKKIIIGIVAAVVALGIIIVAIIGITKGFSPKKGNDSSSSSVISSGSGSSAGSSAQGSGSSSADKKIEKGKMTIEPAKASAGDVISVPIKLSENPGIAAGQFYFEYDTKAFTYDSYEKGDILDDYEVSDAAGKVSCIISADDISKNATANGTLITLKFMVKSDAAKGDYTIKVSDGTMLCDVDENTVSPKLSDGKITVK